MPPRVVPLALAGRRLTAPPEGYGPKKEQQIKGWLKAVPISSFELAQEPAVEDLRVVDAELEKLYKEVDRRESVDGSLRPVAEAPIQVTDSPGQRLSIGAASSSTAGSTHAQPGQQQQQQPGAPGAGRPPSPPGELLLPSPRLHEAQGSPYPNATPGRLPKPGTPQSPLRPPSPGVRPSSPAALASPLQSLHLDFLSEGARPEERAALEVAAGMLMARVEGPRGQAALAAGPGVGAASADEVEKLRRAVMLALLDKQRLQAAVQAELAELRAQAAAYQVDTERQLEAARTDAAVLERRALGAEAELARVRAEAMSIQQQAQAQKLQVDDREDEYKEQIAKLQREAQAMMAKLKEQGTGLEATVRRALEEADAARQQAGKAERLRRQQQHEHELLKARLEMEVGSMRAELLQRSADAARLERDLQVALQARDKAVQARTVAEESEKKALQAATKLLELNGSNEQAKLANESLKQQQVNAARQAALLRAADPVGAAAAAAGGSEQPGPAGRRSTGTARNKPSGRPGSPGPGPLPAAAGASPTQRAASPIKAAKALGVVDPEPFMLQQLRAEQHLLLQRAVAAEKAQLTDAVRMQRRAQLAVQLGEAKDAEAALAAAPEQLRCMGLAFRAYLLGDLSSGSAPAGCAAALSGRYRLFVDPQLQAPQSQSSTLQPSSAHLVRLCAALVVFAAPGLLAQPLARAAVGEAAKHGCPIHIIAPASMSSLNALLGDAGQGQRQEAGVKDEDLDPALGLLSDQASAWLAVAWDARLPAEPGAPAMAESLAQRLGLPDEALKALPAEALRRMAVERTGYLPDLAHLNCARVTALRVALLPAGAGTGVVADRAEGGARAAGAAGAGVSGAGRAPGLSLEQLVSVLRGNKTLTALTVSGCTSTDQAKQLSEALAAFPDSSISRLTFGAEVPLGPLLGRAKGGALLAAMDLSQATGFGPEDAAALCVALQGKGAAALAEVVMPVGAPVLSSRFRSLAAASMEPGGGVGGPRAAVSHSGAAAGDGAGAKAGQGSEGVAGHAALRQLVAALSNLPGLQRVNGVDLSGLGAGMATGALDLSGLELGPIAGCVVLSKAAAVVAAGGCGDKGLVALNLTGCLVGPEGAEQLPALAARLQQVCLADNALGPTGVAAVCRALAGAPGSGIKVLDLSLNLLEDAGVRELATQLLPQLPNLTVLALANNSIKVPGVKALAAALPSLQQLQDLHLSGNLLGDPGVAMLESVLSGLPSLRRLYLQQNYSIAGDGARALAAVLNASSSLEELHLSRNSVGPDGARQLAQGLGSDCSLRLLDLSSCKLRAEGVAHIATSLAVNKCLTSLSLDRNSVGDRGVKSLVEALERNTSLQRLELQSNSITMVGCRLLSTVLRDRNMSVRRLLMGNNDADDPVIEAIEQLAAMQRQPVRAARLLFPPSTRSGASGSGGGGVSSSRAASEQPAPSRPLSAGPSSYARNQDTEPLSARGGAARPVSAVEPTAAARLTAPGGTATPFQSPGGPGQSRRVTMAVAADGSPVSPEQVLSTAAKALSSPPEQLDDDLEQLLDRYRAPATHQQRSSLEPRPFAGYGYTGMHSPPP